MRTLLQYFFFVLIVNFISTNLLAQEPSIDSIKISPENPQKNDFVKIILFTHTISTGEKLHITHQLFPDSIYIEACYKVVGTGSNQYFQDTVLLGQLQDGIYKISFKGYASFDATCNPIDSNIFLDTFIVQPPASIPSIKSHFFIVYPNPTGKFIYVQPSENTIITHIAIQDIHGKTHRQYNNKQQLDVSDLPTGLYLLYINTNNGRFIHRFVKE